MSDFYYNFTEIQKIVSELELLEEYVPSLLRIPAFDTVKYLRNLESKKPLTYQQVMRKIHQNRFDDMEQRILELKNWCYNHPQYMYLIQENNNR